MSFLKHSLDIEALASPFVVDPVLVLRVLFHPLRGEHGGCHLLGIPVMKPLHRDLCAQPQDNMHLQHVVMIAKIS